MLEFSPEKDGIIPALLQLYGVGISWCSSEMSLWSLHRGKMLALSDRLLAGI